MDWVSPWPIKRHDLHNDAGLYDAINGRTQTQTRTALAFCTHRGCVLHWRYLEYHYSFRSPRSPGSENKVEWARRSLHRRGLGSLVRNRCDAKGRKSDHRRTRTFRTTSFRGPRLLRRSQDLGYRTTDSVAGGRFLFPILHSILPCQNVSPGSSWPLGEFKLS